VSTSMPGSAIQDRPLHLGEEIAARVAPEAGLRQALIESPFDDLSSLTIAIFPIYS